MGRAEMLAVIGSLAAFTLYRKAAVQDQDSTWRNQVYLILALFAWLAAALCKETAFVVLGIPCFFTSFN